MMDKSLKQWNDIQKILEPIDLINRKYIENVVYDYMITQIYAEVEEHIENCLREHLISPNRLTNNYLTQQKLHRGLKTENLTDVLHTLRILHKGEIFLPPKIQDIHCRFLNVRHNLTHTTRNDRSADVSIDEIIKNCNRILEEIHKLFNRYDSSI